VKVPISCKPCLAILAILAMRFSQSRSAPKTG
jgi:hypothetical protein